MRCWAGMQIWNVAGVRLHPQPSGKKQENEASRRKYQNQQLIKYLSDLKACTLFYVNWIGPNKRYDVPFALGGFYKGNSMWLLCILQKLCIKWMVTVPGDTVTWITIMCKGSTLPQWWSFLLQRHIFKTTVCSYNPFAISADDSTRHSSQCEPFLGDI